MTLGACGMPTVSFFVDDDRYAVPTLDFVNVEDGRRALEAAKRRLEESPHHLGVEIRDDDKVLAHLMRDDRGRARP